MNVEELRKLTSNGFRPFTIYLSDARSFHVRHPDFVAISRKTVVVIGEDELPSLMDPLHIVSVKPMDEGNR